MTTPDHYTGHPSRSGAAHTNNERFNRLLNGCQSPRAVYAALWALGSTEALDKLREEAHR